LYLTQWFSNFFHIPRLQTQTLSIPPLQKSQKRQWQTFHTTWIWFQVSFEDLSQSKIEALRKNNFTNEQFKESAKKQLAFYQTILQTKFHVLNKTLTKT